jgi:hypothetical protein
MNIAEQSRLHIRLNGLEIAVDLVTPVINAAIIHRAYDRAEQEFRAAASPSATDVYGRLYFAEQWLAQVRSFADALREVAKDELFIVPAKAAAKVYDELFPGVGVQRDLKLVMVSEGQMLTAGPEGEARFPISAEAVIALEAILIALVDALPSRPALKAAG